MLSHATANSLLGASQAASMATNQVLHIGADLLSEDAYAVSPPPQHLLVLRARSEDSASGNKSSMAALPGEAPCLISDERAMVASLTGAIGCR